jgi:HD domain
VCGGGPSGLRPQPIGGAAATIQVAFPSADWSGRAGASLAAETDSMLEHPRSSLSVLRTEAQPLPSGAETPHAQGVDDVAAAGALLEVSRLFTALLRLTRPDIGQRTERITALVSFVVRGLDVERRWEFEVAARLSQLGCLGIAPDVLQAAARGELLNDDDLRAVASHPLAARDLLGEMSRLETVAEMIARQHEPVGIAGEWIEPVRNADRLAFGGQVLRVCGEFDRLVQRGLSCQDALSRMRALPEEFDPVIAARLNVWTAEVASDAVSCSAA